MPGEKRLTRKQTKWAQEYALTGNACESARRAGYGARQRGPENVSKRVFEKWLEEVGDCSEMELLEDKHVLKLLWDEATNPDNNDGTRVRAAEVVGRARGMFRDRVEITSQSTEIEAALALLKGENPQLYAVLAPMLGKDTHDDDGESVVTH